MDVQLCQSGLTKVVTFTPFYLFQNDTKFAVEFNECGEKKWERVPPESVAHWRKEGIIEYPNFSACRCGPVRSANGRR